MEKQEFEYKDLISVIVPVYNNEKYLKRCIDSILCQSYSKLEIILVDDGSTDSSPIICDDYAGSDSRIKVIHKENGGASEARNIGLDKATGQYISFIDSDDWIDKEFISKLYYDAISNGSDVSICGAFLSDGQKRKAICLPKASKMDHDQALEELCNNKWLNSYLWNKLYQKNLFEGIRFNTSLTINEDTAIMHVIFDRAKKISCVKKCMYNYFDNNDSLMHNHSFEKDYDTFQAYYQRYNYFCKRSKFQKKVLRCCAEISYEILFLNSYEYINNAEFQKVKKFWKSHNDIEKLGIKYLLMYKYSRWYRHLKNYI